MPNEVHTAVIGGGITGLCATHQLLKKHGRDDVVLLEAGDRAGGYCGTDRIDGYICDQGPNGFLDKEPLMLEWIEELGLSDRLIHANESSAKRFILLNDRLVEILPPPKFFFSPLLSIPAKLRLMLEPFIPARPNTTPESIWDFAARRIGKEAADNLVSAMVLGVFGGDAHQLSLEHCFPTMAAMESDHGGLVKAMLAKRKDARSGGPAGPSGTLTTLKNGIGTLTETAVDAVGGTLRLNSAVTSITRDTAYTITCEDGTCYEAQEIVLALPAFAAAKITASLDESLSTTLAKIEHASITAICTGYPIEKVGRSVDGFGFLAPPNQGKRALGCIWTSSVFDDFAPEGMVMLRTMIGGARDPEAINLSDAELLDIVARDVHPFMQIDTAPEFQKIFRHNHGIPQYHLNHRDILSTLDEAQQRLPGLTLAGNAYRGVSLNDCVVSAYNAVGKNPIPQNV